MENRNTFSRLTLLVLINIICGTNLFATNHSFTDTLKFRNGNFDENIEWKDNRGEIINAHDGGIIYVNNTYYWYGLALRPLGFDKTGVNNGAATTIGINLYSSKNLYHWKYEGVILPTSNKGNNPLFSPMRMERPKIVYNRKTNKYVLWFHYVGYPGNHGQDKGLADAGVAVADNITGPFSFIGFQRPINDSGAVKDCTLFMDNDSTAFFIYDRKLTDGTRCLYMVKLSDDFLHTTNQWIKIDAANRREAPVMFKHNDQYFLFTSDVSGWKANAAKTYSSSNIMGPWKCIGNSCRGEHMESTFNTQGTYAFNVEGKKDLTIIMLERHNTSNFLKCSYVWLPINFTEDKEPVIQYRKEWSLNDEDSFNE